MGVLTAALLAAMAGNALAMDGAERLVLQALQRDVAAATTAAGAAAAAKTKTPGAATDAVFATYVAIHDEMILELSALARSTLETKLGTLAPLEAAKYAAIKDGEIKVFDTNSFAAFTARIKAVAGPLAASVDGDLAQVKAAVDLYVVRRFLVAQELRVQVRKSFDIAKDACRGACAYARLRDQLTIKRLYLLDYPDPIAIDSTASPGMNKVNMWVNTVLAGNQTVMNGLLGSAHDAAEAAGFSQQSSYAKKSFKTAWNTDITYAWEKEGTESDILLFYWPKVCGGKCKHGVSYEPATGKLATIPDKYNGSITAAEWLALPNQRYFMYANGLYYKDLTKIPWADLRPESQAHVRTLVLGDGTVIDLGTVVYDAWNEVLESEVSDAATYADKEKTTDPAVLLEKGAKRVWECKHRSYTNDLNELLASLAWMAGMFKVPETDPGTYNLDFTSVATFDLAKLDSSTQVHLAFARPGASLDRWAPKMADLAFLLNDRLATHDWAQSPSDVHSRFLAPYLASTRDTLAAKLQQPAIAKTDIEQPDSAGHQVGTWKFGLVSLRHHYGDPNIIGFEIRSSADETFGQVINSLVTFLRDWADWSKAPDADNGTLKLFPGGGKSATYKVAALAGVDHGSAAHTSRISPGAAEYRIRSILESCKDLVVEPFGGAKLEKLTANWMFPMLRWEIHPAVAANLDAVDVISSARFAFEKALAKVPIPWDGPGLVAPVAPSAESCRAAQTAIEAAVSKFFRDTKLWRLF